MKNIVIVDDFAEFAELIKKIVEKNGKFKCKTFTKPFEAIVYLLSHRDEVDILITDYQMPQMNGFELVTRCINENLNMRFIVMSSLTKDDLESLSKEYSLEDDVETVPKDNLSFFRKL